MVTEAAATRTSLRQTAAGFVALTKPRGYKRTTVPHSRQSIVATRTVWAIWAGVPSLSEVA